MTASLTDTRSAELYRRALEVIPGGVNSPVRAMRAIGRDPIFIARGEGAELLDVDGNRYVDYVCSWGPLIHGHAHPEVLAAVEAAAAKGLSFGAPTPGEVELAAEVARRIDGVDMVRMTSSGTEAAMTAIRLARAATGRERVLKFAGAYHGHVDGLLVQAGSGLATQGLPASPGVPAGTAAATVVVPWNDPQALIAASEQHELAAILAEPLPANMGLVPPREGFLELLRERADATGALLVLDEVIIRLPRGARRRAGAARRARRSDDHGQGDRRGGALRRGRRPGRSDADARARRRGLPGRDAVGKPARRRRRPGHARAARRARLPAPVGDHRAPRERPARGGRQLPRAAGERPRAVDRVLQRAPGARAARRRGLRPRRPRRLLSRAALARGLPAALAVRGLVSLARPHRRADRAHARGRRGRVREPARGRGVGMSAKVLERLRGLLREEGGLIATLLHAAPDGERPDGDGPDADGAHRGRSSPACVAAEGPRAEGRREEYELLVEAIYEGYLLHYGSPRVVRAPEADLSLLAGDRLYAIGLARLVALGDTTAVAELADTITLSALAQGAGERELADAVWAAGARAVGWGPNEQHRRAKDLVFAGAPGALEAMRTSAAPRSGST